MEMVLLLIYIILSPFLQASSLIKFNILGMKLSSFIPLIIWSIIIMLILFRRMQGTKIKVDKNTIVLIFISLLVAINYFLKLQHTGPLKFSVLWVCLYFIGLNIQQRVDRKVSLFLILLSGTTAIIVGIILHILNIPLFDPSVTGSTLYFSESGKYRAMGTFLNPNVFGYFCVTFLIFILYLHQDLRVKAFFIIMIIYAVIISQSRTSLIMLTTTLLIHFCSLYKERVIRTVVITIEKVKRSKINKLIAALILLAIVYISAKSVITGSIFTNVRIKRWEVGIDYIFQSMSNFLIGMRGDTTIIGNLESGVTFSDNHYIYVFLLYGIIGFISFMYFYLHNLLFYYKKVKESNSSVYIAVFELLVVYMIASFFSDAYQMIPVTFYVPLFLGMGKSYVLKRWKTNETIISL